MVSMRSSASGIISTILPQCHNTWICGLTTKYTCMFLKLVDAIQTKVTHFDQLVKFLVSHTGRLK